MTEPALSAAEFPAFFRAVWGVDPFPWQQALAARVLNPDPTADAGWPDAITLPTAAGKTACLDIALYTLAAAERSGLGAGQAPPRRIFFVVDRRVIVDEAFERARALADWLARAQTGVGGRVAAALRRLAGDGAPPLVCFQLRGGIYRDNAWARSPVQPTIVCSTVDQVGSRLLYRAYGRSFKSWHLEAGLVGNDSLILLDEAHCAEPFRQTLAAVARYRQWADTPLPLPFHLVVMTATPTQGQCDFPDPATRAADQAHPVLGRRLSAHKPCRLVVADRAQGRDPAKVNQALADQLVAEARRLIDDWAGPAAAADEFQLVPPGDLAETAPAAGTPGAPAVAIFCNRVDTARRAHMLLARWPELDAVLLTGRMRPLDRDDTLHGPLSSLAAGKAEGRRLVRPLVVVATQTLEVGANLDFDLLVSECADLAALRQRFGRLNRMGRPINARGVIVVRADQQHADASPDPVYGEALARTWAWLTTNADAAGGVDFGIAALAALSSEDQRSLTAASVDATVLLPAHLDALVQTAPAPEPTPEIALFLHGPRGGPPDVQVCWRADLLFDPEVGREPDEADWREAVAACPPAVGELMPVPFLSFRRWFAGHSDAADGGDIEGTAAATDDGARDHESGPTMRRVGLCWRGPEDSWLATTPADLRPGEVIVLPASLGGWDELGHRPRGAAADLGDRAHLLTRARPVLRLSAATIADWPWASAVTADNADGTDADPGAALAALAGAAEAELEQDPAGFIAQLREQLARLAADPTTPGWLQVIADDLARDPQLQRGLLAGKGNGLILRASRPLGAKARARLALADQAGATFTHEDDATASGSVSRPVPLDEHLAGVRAMAERFTADLPPALAADVQLAAALHDLGKADPRFQSLLRGGNRWLTGPLLAKSGDLPKSPAACARAAAASGYPPGARHELLSVRLIQSARPALLAGAHDPDLVLHLVASHHGWCRPFAPVVADPDHQWVRLDWQGQALAADTATGLERLDSGVAGRFWRLVRRYGWWGLAGLEAAMMLADHRRSEWEEQQHEISAP